MLGHRDMSGLAITTGQRVVGDLSQQRLRECVLTPIRREPVGAYPEDLPADQVREQAVELVDRHVADRCHGRPRECAAEHGQALHEGTLVRWQRVDPGGYE